MAHPEPPDPGLPIKLEPCSNGEFLPAPSTELVRRTIERTNQVVEAKARRLGMSRRAFLRSSLGAATMMTVFAACTREQGQTGGTFDPTTTTGASTSTPEAESDVTLDEAAADEALAAGDQEFIFDVQGHLLEYPDDAPGDPGFGQSACGEARPGDCYGIDHFLEAMFLDSDTALVMLSAIPFGGGALSPEVMERAIAAADAMGCVDRVLMQGESFPTSVGLDAMERVAADFPIRAFKTYTHTGGDPWRLDDDIGNAYFDKVREVGVRTVAVHKGISGGNVWSSPVDVGPAAVNHPDIDILVYHSGYESSSVEGPYDPSADVGVNRLIRSVNDAGSPGNVYAELGSTWRNIMGSPNEAAHLIGKLLVHLGEDNILWGTDSIWYGSPQDQIQLFRSFQISEEFQERFGYPALTPEIKNKIFGANAARVFGVDLPAVACGIDAEGIESLREERAAGPLGEPTHHTHAEAGLRTFLREFGGGTV